jgi:hypothetical protein
LHSQTNDVSRFLDGKAPTNKFQIMKTIKGVATTGALLLFSAALAQTNLNFNSISATVEGAIRLSWNSTSNEVYEIDYANDLIDTNTGVITWQPLYKDYPSHGTNTFWLDTGDYHRTPIVPHPKYTGTRFYRIVKTGTNTAPAPFVAISSPASNAALSGQATISVNTASSGALVYPKLYVDGQEMRQSPDGTNFTINTCEWPNGSHVIFATATALSTLPGPSGSHPVNIGRSVSAYVPVTFSNLITRVAFSEVFFEPSLGQTQTVTATFSANVDWTLQMMNESSNAVRTVTGSGSFLQYNWDGTGDGGTNIPDGVYHYVITVQTNGLPLSPLAVGGGESIASLSSASTSNEIEDTLLWVQQADGTVVPLSLYPPGTDTNGFNIFEASASWNPYHRSSSFQSFRTFQNSDSSPDGQTGFGGSGQGTTAPTRPQTAAVKNPAGSFAVGYYTYQDPLMISLPNNGLPPYTQRIHLDGDPTTSPAYFDSMTLHADEAHYFVSFMEDSGWKLIFNLSDGALPVNSIRRYDASVYGGELFTQATIGFFMSHGSYGTDQDFSSGSSGSKQTYFSTGNSSDLSNPWLRMCHFGFGGSLKWMAITGCNSLADPNWSSMSSAGGIPLKTTHLLCGAKTITYANWGLGSFWAEHMLSDKQRIADAWFNAGIDSMAGATNSTTPNTNVTSTVIFRVAGYPESMNDTIATNAGPNSPSATPRNLTKEDKTVFEPVQ